MKGRRQRFDSPHETHHNAPAIGKAQHGSCDGLWVRRLTGELRSDRETALTASSCLIAVFALGQGLNVDVTSNPSWWTYVPAVVSALAAVAAFSIAFAAWWRGTNDRVLEQASKIFVSSRKSKNADGSWTIIACVHNMSDVPIWGVEVRPRRDGKAYGAGINQLRPDILPAATAEDWSWTVSAMDIGLEERQPELRFTDGAERRWKRIGMSITRL